MRPVHSAVSWPCNFGVDRHHVSAAAPLPRASLVSAPAITLPGAVDSNSPVMWDLEDGQRRMFVLTSHSGVPSRSLGTEIDRLGGTAEVSLLPHPGYGVWFEAVVSDDVETWYGYYHNEWPATRCGREDRAVPRIGAAKSTDNGRTWTDLGPVIQAYQSATSCESPNRYVIGGVGDVSVMLDQSKTYLYFFYSQYHRDPLAQGVAIGRLLWADRERPGGRVELWRGGIWEPEAGRRTFSPGLPGRTLASRVGLPRGVAAHHARVRVARRRRQGRCVLGTVGPLEHCHRAIRDAAQSREGRELRAGRHLRFVRAAARRSIALDRAAEAAERRPLVPTGHRFVHWHRDGQARAGSARLFMSGKSEWVINFTK